LTNVSKYFDIKCQLKMAYLLSINIGEIVKKY